MTTLGLFLLALLVAWVRLRLIRSRAFWWMVSVAHAAGLVTIALVHATESILFTKNGRLRSRSEIRLAVLTEFGRMMLVAVEVEAWKLRNGKHHG